MTFATGSLLQTFVVLLGVTGYVVLLNRFEEGMPARTLLAAAYFFLFVGYGALLEAATVFLVREWSGLDSLALLPPLFVASVSLPVFAVLLFRHRKKSRFHAVALWLCVLYVLPFCVGLFHRFVSEPAVCESCDRHHSVPAR